MLILGFSKLSLAQDDGPRVYWNAPTGTNVFEGYAWFFQSNSLYANSSIYDPDLVSNGLSVIFNYNRYFKIAGKTVIGTVSLPMGNATADLDTNLTQSTRGLGDSYLQLVVNLLGAPGLDLESFAEYEQRTILSLLTGVSAPIGNYDANQLLNMGENRWGFRVGTPFVQTIGKWIPGKLTTIELVPSVWFFTPNNNFANNLELKQKMLFLFEAHVTRDITDNFFVSLDYMNQQGGETSLAGENQNDASNANFLGATLGFMLNQQLQFKFRYNASLKPNENSGIDMDMLQLNFSYLW